MSGRNQQQTEEMVGDNGKTSNQADAEINALLCGLQPSRLLEYLWNLPNERWETCQSNKGKQTQQICIDWYCLYCSHRIPQFNWSDETAQCSGLAGRCECSVVFRRYERTAVQDCNCAHFFLQVESDTIFPVFSSNFPFRQNLLSTHIKWEKTCLDGEVIRTHFWRSRPARIP